MCTHLLKYQLHKEVLTKTLITNAPAYPVFCRLESTEKHNYYLLQGRYHKYLLDSGQLYQLINKNEVAFIT